MMRVAIALAVLIGSSTSIRADKGAPGSGKDRRVGILLIGDHDALTPRVAARLYRVMGQIGMTAIADPISPEALATLNDCFVMDDADCARNVVTHVAKQSQVVYLRFYSRPHPKAAPDITLTAYYFQNGQAPISEKTTCQTCSDLMLDATVDMLIDKLIGRVLPGHVRFISKPTGARISIDKLAIGVTPLDRDMPPGPHTIQMDLPGWEGTREVVVRSAETEVVEMQLVSTAKRARGDVATPAARKTEPVARAIDVDIVESKRAGTRTQITVSRGSAAGVAVGTKGVLLDPHGNPLPAGSFTIEKTTEDECYAILDLPLSQLIDIKHARLRL